MLFLIERTRMIFFQMDDYDVSQIDVKICGQKKWHRRAASSTVKEDYCSMEGKYVCTDQLPKSGNRLAATYQSQQRRGGGAATPNQYASSESLMLENVTCCAIT